jgi:hypothetical protein
MERDPEELPPLPLEAEPILEALNAHQVQYVVIGGMALQARGIGARETFDLDIVPAADRPNLQQLAETLAALDTRVITKWVPEAPELHVEEPVFEPEMFQRNRILHILTRHGRADVLMEAPGATGGFAELAPDADEAQIGRATFAVASVQHMIRMKEAVGRPKDLEDLVALRAAMAVPEVEPRPVRPQASRRRQAARRREDEARRRDTHREGHPALRPA